MKQRLSTMLRLSVIVVGGLASVATSKVESGDRANGGDGDCIFLCDDDDPGPTCPAGEVCSDATPTGLYFGGTPTGAVGPFKTEWPQPTAIGGSQTIHLWLDSKATRPLNVPFAAHVTTDAVSIRRERTASVTIDGEQDGTAKLRITEPDSDLLYDRLDVSARPVQRAQVVPAGNYLFYDLDLIGGDEPFVVLTGRTTRVTAQLLGPADVRVVDETMTFDASPVVDADPLGFADTVAVTPTSPGPVVMSVRSGGVPRSITVNAVRRAERIDLVLAEEPLTVRAERPHLICFRPMVGDAAVVGSSWNFIPGPGLTVSEQVYDVAAACLDVTAADLGDTSLTVTGAGTSATFTIRVEAAKASAKRTLAAPREEPAALGGDRASAP